MSEFINKSKIAALNQSNVELSDEISTLQAQCQRLSAEIEQLKNRAPDDVELLKQSLAAYGQRETELKDALELFTWKAKTTKDSAEIIDQLMNALQLTDDGSVEFAIKQHYKQRWAPKLIIAFLLGVLSPLLAWHIFLYQQSGELPFAFIERLLNFFGR
jgi:chromosome segregation ATPase